MATVLLDLADGIKRDFDIDGAACALVLDPGVVLRFENQASGTTCPAHVPRPTSGGASPIRAVAGQGEGRNHRAG